MDQPHDLADKISDLAFSYYEKLKPSAKPVIRSNGVKEWNVLACVIAIGPDQDLRLVSLATGVKSTPNDELKRSNGRILHDCHAEILALRGFNMVLLKQIQMLVDPKAAVVPDLVSPSSDEDGKFKLGDDWSFALYISRIPCGDASMDLLQSESDMEFSEDTSCQYVNPCNRTILRGRFNYNKRGYVRTKPGRKDSSLTLSKSCSDKLCYRQVMSILNAMTWDLMESPIFLKYIVVPKVSNTARRGFESAFKDRLREFPGIKSVELLECSKQFPDDKFELNQVPSSVSGILLNTNDGQPEQQSILNGVKSGAYVREPKPLRKNCETMISRLAQWTLFKKVTNYSDKKSYQAFKGEQVARNVLKNKVRSSLSSDGWISTGPDDFA